MCAHGGARAIAIVPSDSFEQASVLILHALEMLVFGRRHELEPQQSFVQSTENLRQNSVFGSFGHGVVKFSVQIHGTLIVAWRNRKFRALQDHTHLWDFGFGRTFGSEAGAMNLVDQSHLDDLEHIVQRNRFDDDALTRRDRYDAEVGKALLVPMCDQAPGIQRFAFR